MPLPWNPQKRGTRIPDVAQRAITVNQLRELRQFLQRLAKLGLLRNTTEFSKTNGTFGQLIGWEEVNLYQVADEVIKKVIPYVDPGGRDPGGTARRWYSWVEFIAEKPQPGAMMFSHWWGGRLKDFMAIVEKLVVDRSLSINTTIWICTFANCQFGEDFGPMLKDCPFIRALRTVELVVLLVDFQGGSLLRTWCGLEMHYATQQEQELILYTSAGRVGSSYVSGGPLVERVKEWDIRLSEASEPSYRRQIFNYVAGVEELKGLRKNGAGGMLADTMGRPQLQDEEQVVAEGEDNDDDAGVPCRITGEAEYKYESRLFRSRAKKFEDLNMMVRLKVLRFLSDGRKHQGCVSAGLDLAARGITLEQLRIVSKKLEVTCPWKPETCRWWAPGVPGFEEKAVPFESLTSYHVSEWVKHVTSSHGECSMMEIIAEGPQVPQFMLDHCWKLPWADHMRAIELFAEANRLPDSAIFFLDLLCLNQNKHTKQHKDDVDMFTEGGVTKECKATLLSLSSEPGQFKRAWIWRGVASALERGKGIFLADRHGIIACNQPFPDGAWVCGHFEEKLTSLIGGFDIGECRCGRETDQAKIMQFFKSQPGGVDRFNARVRRWCAGTVLRSAAAADDVMMVDKVADLQGLRLNSDTMKGCLGDTPLHIATSSGSLGVLRALLKAGVDPDVEDSISERPLHWAAAAGRADVAKELLAAKADPSAENAFTETPLEVARQNPAAFLGVDTSAVVALLEAYEPAAAENGAAEVAAEAAGSALSAARTLAGGRAGADDCCNVAP